MAVSGIVIVPLRGEEEALRGKLEALPGAEVQGAGPAGIAAVLEAATTQLLEEMSERIRGWEEVVEFHLAYLNWE